MHYSDNFEFQLAETTNEELLLSAANKHIDVIIQAGYTKPIANIKFNEKESLIRLICLNHALLKSKAELDQLHRGLHLFDVESLMKQFSSLFECFFISKKETLTASKTTTCILYYLCLIL